jgi:hypothetical protein
MRSNTLEQGGEPASPERKKGVLGQRPSQSVDGAWWKENERLKKLTPYERMAEALALSDDDFPTSA